MYSMYAESKGFKTEILNANETGLGGYKEISFSVEGDGAYRFKFESGGSPCSACTRNRKSGQNTYLHHNGSGFAGG